MSDVFFSQEEQEKFTKDFSKFFNKLTPRTVVKDFKVNTYPKFLSDDSVNYEVLFEIITGSRLYGNYTEDSDYDYRGCFIEKTSDMLSGKEHPEHIENKEGTLDAEYYSLNKLRNLLLSGNPNSHELIFAPCDAYTYISPRGLYLKYHRSLFLSKSKIQDSYQGYAQSQLKRIKNHNRWLDKFPKIHSFMSALSTAFEDEFISEIWIKDKVSGIILTKISGSSETDFTRNHEKDRRDPVEVAKKYFEGSPEEFLTYLFPSEEDFIFLRDMEINRVSKSDHLEFLRTEATYRSISSDQMVIYDGGSGIFSVEGRIKGNPGKSIGNPRFLMTRDSGGYKSRAKEMGSLYMWIVNRNEKRAELEKHHGYDTKHASHCIRLLVNGIELLTNGDYDPRLSDSNLSLIKAIRAGEVGYQEILDMAGDLVLKMEEAKNKSDLPEEIDIERVNRLILELRE